VKPQTSSILVRGRILHFLRDPAQSGAGPAWEYHPDGALFIENGIVRRCAAWAQVLESLPELTHEAARYHDYSGRLIVPGFVDCHTHFAQLRVMGAYGHQLLEWLERYVFPAEAAFADEGRARRSAAFFLDRLLAHGTTTASVFATVHAHAVDAFFAEASRRSLRMLCGKVLMDRNCPENLRDTPELAHQESAALIERWHGKGRLRYSITPRFAPTSSPAQLAVAGELYHSRKDLHLQSHLAENLAELAWVRELFPQCRDYTDVYDSYGLLGPRTIYAHGIHLSAPERRRLAETQTAIATCPSSNLFLGSGFFQTAAQDDEAMPLGFGSDVGAGTSLSMLRTMAAAYQVGQVHQESLSPWQAWYRASLGGASALGLDAFIGNFLPGREADFAVLDARRIPELAFRLEGNTDLAEELFALMMLGDERCVLATHVLGECAHHLDGLGIQ
jgi:guanine deaminase